MKTFRKICFIIMLIILTLTIILNIILIKQKNANTGLYRVEAKRLTDEINETGAYDLSKYPHLLAVYPEHDGDLYETDEQYLIISAGDELYRVEYDIRKDNSEVLIINLFIAIIALVFALMLIYIRRHILLPFNRINSVPQELAKGNLAVEIPEEKSRFFSKFTWGVNMLRENIETSRKNEISMQRDKKLLLLSLSHDIKTPLSAIKLNAKALAKGLYPDEEKRRAAADSINARADEIESFVSQITQAASEDFMTFEVNIGEEFLSKITGKILARYSSQLAMKGTDFIVNEFSDCLLSCDPDRLAECLQNLVENAIKYGDGKLIEISFEKMDGCQLITVSNTGCTLTPAELPQIFESFHRGSNSGKIQGNGLGLFICRRIMSLMEGEVYADISDDRFNATLVVRLA